MHVQREAEIGGQVAADLVPGIAGVVAAHHVPVLLHEQHVRTRGVHGDVVHAVAHFGAQVGNVAGPQATVDGLPRDAAVVGAEGARGRDGDEDSPGIGGIEKDGVQTHPAGAWLPARSGAVAAQSGKLLPGLAGVGGAEQGSVLNPGVDAIRVLQRRLQVPDPRELPRVRRAVVPLVSAGHAIVDKLVAHRHPRLTAIARALDRLPVPARPLGGIEAVRVGGRPLEVINLPAPKVGTGNFPLLASCVRG